MSKHAGLRSVIATAMTVIGLSTNSMAEDSSKLERFIQKNRFNDLNRPYQIKADDDTVLPIRPIEGCSFTNSETYFSMHGSWLFKRGQASLPCIGARADFIAIYPARGLPVATYFPLRDHRLISQKGDVKVYRKGLPDKNFYEVVAFIGADGRDVYVRYETLDSRNLLAHRRLNDKFELTYGASLSHEKPSPEYLMKLDRMISDYAVKLVREEK